MKKLDKIIIYSVFIIPTILVFGYAFWAAIFGETAYKIAATRDINKAFNGKVDSLFFVVENHNIKVAKLENGNICEIFRLWERYIEVGDSLSKKQGFFVLEVYKKNGKKFTFDYRDTYQKK